MRNINDLSSWENYEKKLLKKRDSKNSPKKMNQNIN